MSLQEHGVITGIVPVGGWHYLQQWTGGIQRIPPTGEARDSMALVRQVTLFRVNQDIEIGDVECEVADYIKGISPANIRKNVPRKEAKPSEKPLIQRIQDWLTELIPQRPKPLREAIARERGAICVACPQHIRWKSAKCSECNESVEYRGRVLRQKAAFDLDRELTGGCRLHNFLCSAAVFLSEEYLPKRNVSAPAVCWLQ